MGRLRVEVVEAWPDRRRRVQVELEEGATVGDALRAARVPASRAVGVHGRRAAPGQLLADGDRVELYRPLRADPKEARRRRALSRRTSR
jgi:putative ubiquitin-RnfH superfamily antitoxin RatB of RatAB toxin-antitoxin module